MAVQCPNCGSTHIQPLSVVHADGTQNFSASLTGMTVDGKFVQGVSHGTQSTLLAQRCAPPAPPSPMPFIGAYGIGGLILYWAMTSCNLVERGCRYDMSALGFMFYNWKQAAVGLGILALGWLLMKGWYQLAKEYNVAKRRWQNSWFCFGCGQTHRWQDG